ncbi:MAG: type VI secretion system baseplate subunit TssF [Gammaproteobacteria bacterium]|nr:type VI secretion system baseplate subunit TssF [Gammaproteobacteria bacterium]
MSKQRASREEILLRYYTQELTYLRKMGAVFADQYPKIGARLELGEEECPDPHVERLIEAFAFLTGRIQRNIDSEFPIFTTALLENLYPHYLLPVPSLAIVQFETDPEQGQFTGGHLIRKQTPLFTQTPQGEVCRFRTCYPVTLWPLHVSFAGIEPVEKYKFLDASPETAGVLRLRFTVQNTFLKPLKLDRIRLHLHGAWLTIAPLYELLSLHILRIALLSPNSDRPTAVIPAEALAPAGFDEEILPYPSNAHPAYRLLQEYFVFPDKFLFFDLGLLERLAPAEKQKEFDVLFLLDTKPGKNLRIDTNTFRLGCTPAINLFPKVSEPIRLHHRQTEYRLVPDARWERSTEIHTILKVTASSDIRDDSVELQPFYSFKHDPSDEPHRAFYYGRRVPTVRPELPGTDMMLSFLDLDFTPRVPANQTLFAHTLCTSRHLAAQVPAGALLQIEEAAPLTRISCLKPPTSQLNSPMEGATVWRSISHLSLNYLSITGDSAGLSALQEILRLYSLRGDKRVDRQIAGIRNMNMRQVVRRLGPDAWRGFVRGYEITLEFDTDLYAGSSAFLLAGVLERFFALYTSANSFTQLVIKRQSQEGVWKRWQPRAGEKILL